MKSMWVAFRSTRIGSWFGRLRRPSRSNRILRSKFPFWICVFSSIMVLEFPMKVPTLRLLAIGAGAMLLTSAYVRVPSSSIMETAAKSFLNSLTPEQRAKATYKFEDDHRFDWHFIPKPRNVLLLREMTTFQTKLAHALLSAG